MSAFEKCSQWQRLAASAGLPPCAVLHASYSPVSDEIALAVRVGADSERDTLDRRAMIAALDLTQYVRVVLGSFLAPLPHRFRASWARPGEAWPDCLPPMVDTAPLLGLCDGEGLPPMFPRCSC